MGGAFALAKQNVFQACNAYLMCLTCHTWISRCWSFGGGGSTGHSLWGLDCTDVVSCRPQSQALTRRAWTQACLCRAEFVYDVALSITTHIWGLFCTSQAVSKRQLRSLQLQASALFLQCSTAAQSWVLMTHIFAVLCFHLWYSQSFHMVVRYGVTKGPPSFRK